MGWRLRLIDHPGDGELLWEAWGRMCDRLHGDYLDLRGVAGPAGLLFASLTKVGLALNEYLEVVGQGE
eukprot:10408331-Alexandrium_andersonii.AAC.1